MNKRAIYLGLFLFALVLGGFLIPSRFAVTLTPSLDYRVFYIDRNPGILKKGDYVMFFIVSKYHGDKSLTVIKQIACDEGESLENIGRDFWCNRDKYLATAKEYSKKGERLEHFAYSGMIPKGHIFVVGHRKDSFDSRYFGFIKKSDVIAKAYPIL